MIRLLLVVLLVPAAALAQGDEVIAALGGVEMRASEVRKLLMAQPPQVREQLLGSPPALDRLVRTELFRRVLVAEARAKGWDKRPEAIERMERAREQALVSSYVDGLARPPADYPAEADLRAAYEANKAELTVPKQYRVAQIYATTREKAEDLAKKARATGADFSALARTGSEHAESAARGGEMGWIAESQTLPEVAKALSAMKPGEVSAPIQSASGWHVVKLLEAREAALRPFAEVRAELATALRLRRAQENEQRHYDAMLKDNPIAVNEVALVRLKNELAKTR
ncbi:MAG TPA: peptidylprolyl isomerase [Burkholderiales bacterium]|nr:peptidylprolyl isomerase [Burkholderiales bacterium]